MNENLYYEEKLLYLLLKEKTCVIEGLGSIKSEWFSKLEYKNLCKYIFEHYSLYKELLTQESFTFYLTRDNFSNTQIETHVNTFFYLLNFETTKENYVFLKDKVFEAWRLREVLRTVNRALVNYEKGLYEKGFESIKKKIISLYSETLQNDFIDRGEIFEDFEKRKALLEEKRKNPSRYQGFLTGIKALDELTGGLWRGELGCIFGKTMIGKSTLALSFGREAYQNGYKVLYITEEMPKIQVMLRFDASLSKIEYKKFKEPCFLSDGEQQRWEYRVSELKELYEKGARFYIHHLPIGCDVLSIQGEIEHLLLVKNTLPDLVIIDDLDMMSYPKRYSREEGMVMNARGLKSLSGRYNIGIWFTKQAATSAYDKQVLQIQDLAFAKGVVHQADMVLGLHQNEEENKLGRLSLRVLKYRDGPVGKLVYLSPDLSKALIHSENDEFIST